ncbi:MAG: DUF3788 domain-containing protein [Asgard group archaeon]|nr:DUF3788 domain-containing protein [Asgard group archaeon]
MTEDDVELIGLISEKEPTDNEILIFVGNAVKPWKEFTAFMNENYDLIAEKKNYGKKWGWAIRYRKSNRTWCALYPRKDCFQVQIIFGKKEVEKFEKARSDFSDFVLNKFDTTRQLHDGRWMFFTVKDTTLIEDLKKLMLIKRKPKKS